MEKEKIYLAYGSNLNLEQMKKRCPGAKPLKKGILFGYELKFRGDKLNSHATIVKKEGGRVPVLLWSITEKDELRLNRYEGWPIYYYKENIEVELDGKKMIAMAYLMNPKRTVGIPSSRYILTIKKGYKDLGFSMKILDEALENNLDEYVKSTK